MFLFFFLDAPFTAGTLVSNVFLGFFTILSVLGGGGADSVLKHVVSVSSRHIYL